MSRYAKLDQIPAMEQLSLGRMALWAVAGTIILSVHVGAAAWVMRTAPAEAMPESAAAAIMIELAPEPVAPETDIEEIAAQQTQSEQAMAAQPTESPNETDEVLEPKEDIAPETPQKFVQNPIPEDNVLEMEKETPPVEPKQSVDMPDPVKTETTQEATAVLDAVNVPLPTPRPAYKQKKTKKVKPAKKIKAKPQSNSAASQATAKAKLKTRKASVAAARQSSRGSSRVLSPARWQSRLLAHLERRKRYPSAARRSKQQGVALVRFRIDANGKVLSARLSRSSGFAALDQEAISMVRRASPVPAPPPGVNRNITVPVRFNLR